MPPNALHTAVAYRNVQPRAQVISPGPVSKQVDSNVASAENRLPQQVPADIRFEDVYALHGTRRQKLVTAADLHSLTVGAHKLLWIICGDTLASGRGSASRR